MNETIQVTIHKPLYDTYVNIRDTYIKQAIRQGKKLEITIPQGTAIVDPLEWVKTGKVHMQVFRIANKPMRMVGNYVPIKTEKKKEKLEIEQMTLL